jgi:hypothetical protein
MGEFSASRIASNAMSCSHHRATLTRRYPDLHVHVLAMMTSSEIVLTPAIASALQGVYCNFPEL